MEVQPKKIGTHNGRFHTDEVLACTMLSKYTAEFKDGVITRTREQDVLDQQDIVVDVGGIYDPSKHRYDHHQRSFVDTFGEGFTIRLSSAGLIYKHFGKEIIQNVVKSLLEEYKDKLTVTIEPTEEFLAQLYTRVYKSFIMGVDGIDNGVEQYPKDVPRQYSNSTDLGSRISRLYPMWTEKDANEDGRFRSAMEIADSELRHQVGHSLLSIYPARNEVKKAVEGRFTVHPSGELMTLITPVPWKDHLEDLEKSLGIQHQLKFIIFPENEEQQKWRIQAIPLNWGTFDFRIGLKEEWRGIKDLKELQTVSSIPDIVFVHNSGFIGGAVSYESVIRMALESIQAHKEKQEAAKSE